MSFKEVEPLTKSDFDCHVNADRSRLFLCKHEHGSMRVGLEDAIALRAWLNEAIDDGMVLVPREPTEAMVFDGANACMEQQSNSRVRAIYRAMIAGGA